MGLVAWIIVAVCFFVVCLGEDTDDKCLGSGSSCTQFGAALLQYGKRVHQVSEHSVVEPDSRAALVRIFAEHWLRVVEENVVPQAALVSCAHLPTEALEYFQEVNKLASVCASDGVPGQKIPGKGDVSLYLRFVEAPCTAQEPSLNANHIADCVFSTAERSPADVDAWSDLNWDNLVAFEEKHAAALRDVGQTCAQVFSDTGECSLSLAQKYARAPQQTQKRVEKVRWLTRPVKHALAAAIGYSHSLLELQAEGNHYYELEVYPGADGPQVFARQVDTASDVGGRAYFEASGEQLKSDLSVSAVLNELKANSNAYDMIHNNCHSMVQKTLRQLTAPGVVIPESPMAKWEAVAARLDASVPKMLEQALLGIGVSRQELQLSR